MPWCPECKAEYRDGFTKCSDCHVDLVEELEPSPKEKKSAAMGKPLSKEQSKPEDYNEVFLINIEDAVELSYIKTMFEDEKIKYRVADESSGGYLETLHGKSFFGKNIFIDKKSYDKAISILESLEEIQMAQETKTEPENVQNKKATPGKILIWIFLGLPFVALIVFFIMKLFN